MAPSLFRALQNLSSSKKPATKARDGIKPLHQRADRIQGKPARKIIRARPVKAAKDVV